MDRAGTLERIFLRGHRAGGHGRDEEGRYFEREDPVRERQGSTFQEHERPDDGL